MKKLITSALVAATFSLTAGMVSAADAPKTIDQLLQQVKVDRANEGKTNAKREREFQAERGDKASLLKREKDALAAEKQRGKDLNQAFLDNERKLAQLEEDLKQLKVTWVKCSVLLKVKLAISLVNWLHQTSVHSSLVVMHSSLI